MLNESTFKVVLLYQKAMIDWAIGRDKTVTFTYTKSTTMPANCDLNQGQFKAQEWKGEWP